MHHSQLVQKKRNQVSSAQVPWSPILFFPDVSPQPFPNLSRASKLSCSVTFNFCDPLNRNPPGSSVHGVVQARILEWVAISFPRGSSQTRDRTHISCVSCIEDIFFTHWAIGEAPVQGCLPKLSNCRYSCHARKPPVAPWCLEYQTPASRSDSPQGHPWSSCHLSFPQGLPLFCDTSECLVALGRTAILFIIANKLLSTFLACFLSGPHCLHGGGCEARSAASSKHPPHPNHCPPNTRPHPATHTLLPSITSFGRNCWAHHIYWGKHCRGWPALCHRPASVIHLHYVPKALDAGPSALKP